MFKNIGRCFLLVEPNSEAWNLLKSYKSSDIYTRISITHGSLMFRSMSSVKHFFNAAFVKEVKSEWTSRPTDPLESACKISFDALPFRRKQNASCSDVKITGSASASLYLTHTWRTQGAFIQWKWYMKTCCVSSHLNIYVKFILLYILLRYHWVAEVLLFVYMIA